MAENSGKKDGYQITTENLAIAISKHKGCEISKIEIEDFTVKGGSKV